MANGTSVEYLNKTDEAFETEKIQKAFSSLFEKYNNIALLVNSEGTLLPYDFGAAKELILNVKDPYFMKKAKYALERLPRNDALLGLLKQFMSINKDKIILISASNLDELEITEYQIFRKIAILEEELAQNQEALEREVGPVSSLKTSLAPNTLLIFFNDMLDQEGRPPITLTRYLHSAQPHASTLDTLSIPMPRFTEKVPQNYKQLLYISVLSSLQQKPIPLEDIIRK